MYGYAEMALMQLHLIADLVLRLAMVELMAM